MLDQVSTSTRRRSKDAAAFESVSQAAADVRFCELLYATLGTWGLVRMGGAAMRSFSSFREALEGEAPSLNRFAKWQIGDLSDADLQTASDELCRGIGRLQLTEAHAKLVANTKALHHLLPELVPPMDREHVGWFFRWNPTRLQEYEQPFIDIFPRYRDIAKCVDIQDYLSAGGPWRTSITKVIDNAIVGYSLTHQETATHSPNSGL